jgi:phosphomannomutase
VREVETYRHHHTKIFVGDATLDRAHDSVKGMVGCMDRLFDGMIMSVSGVRGVLGSALTPEVASRLGAAFGLMLGRGSYLIARDSRPSGSGLAAAAAAGLESVGCEPVMAGIMTTPGAQVLVGELGLKGGIIVTASHNPQEWNGLKFVGEDETFLSPDQAELLYEQSRGLVRHYVETASLPRRRTICTGSRIHVNRIVSSSLVNIGAVRKRRFTLVVDCNHGAAGPILRELGGFLDLNLIIIGEEASGLFTHAPEPSLESLESLGAAVKEAHADAGAALDPDGDRLVFCTADGEVLSEEATLPLVAGAVLARENGTVVTNLSTSMMIDHVVDKAGGTLLRTPVGEAHVVGAMKEKQAVVGGEGNGGVILPSIHLGRDGAAALSVFLTFLAEQPRSVASAWREIPKYHMTKRKISATAVDWSTFSNHVVERYPACKTTHIDGLRIDGDDWWAHIRPSNTEPVIRVIAEGARQTRVEDVVGSIIELLAHTAHEDGG